MTSTEQSPAVPDNHAFNTGLGRTGAMHSAALLCRHFEESFTHAEYLGPLAAAGGYVRDIALARNPKDLDLFIDGGYHPDASLIASSLAKTLNGAKVGQLMPCYGTWAKDVDLVIKLDTSEVAPADWMNGTLPVPTDIDIIVLRAQELAKVGYRKRMINDAYNQELFLKAVLTRVDLRLNSIGATPLCTHAHPEWMHDAYYSRLVIQRERVSEALVEGAAPELLGRIEKRIRRLSTEKYQNWEVAYEDDAGQLHGDLSEAADSNRILGHGNQRTPS